MGREDELAQRNAGSFASLPCGQFADRKVMSLFLEPFNKTHFYCDHMMQINAATGI